MIKAENVVKHFGSFKVLNNLNLHVPKGSVYGLVGPNGAGKTTIINHLTGAYKPEQGTITIGGETVFENPDGKKRVLGIADDWYYFNTYSIKQMADFYKSVYPSFNTERYEKIKACFDLDEKRQIRKLSKGMKKQAAFWLTLSCMPDVLILDEPLDGLDPVMRKQVLGLVISDVAEREMTVLVSSHNLRELEDICDYVGILHKGEMIIEKPLDDLKGSVHKYQLVFDGGVPVGLESDGCVLNLSRTGSVCTAILKGDLDVCDIFVNSFNPRVCDRLSLTLEEVFIYELGGLGYDYKNIL